MGKTIPSWILALLCVLGIIVFVILLTFIAKLIGVIIFFSILAFVFIWFTFYIVIGMER